MPKNPSLSDFSFVGGRPYIRGADVLALFLFDFSDQIPMSMIKYFRMIRPLLANGHWVLQDASADILPSNPAASLRVACMGRGARNAHFIEDGAKIERNSPRIEPMVTHIDQEAPFEGRVSLRDTRNVAEQLNAAVEVNKSLHEMALETDSQKASIRLIYLENFPLKQPFPKLVDVRLLSSRTVGDSVYNLSSISDKNTGWTMRICFSFLRKSGQ